MSDIKNFINPNVYILFSSTSSQNGQTTTKPMKVFGDSESAERSKQLVQDLDANVKWFVMPCEVHESVINLFSGPKKVSFPEGSIDPALQNIYEP